jgi:hypothetical protein
VVCLALCGGRSFAQPAGVSYPMLPPPPPPSVAAPAPAVELARPRPATAADEAVRTAAMQQPLPGPLPPGSGGPITPEETQAYNIHIEPPGPEAVFGHLESEYSFFQRLRQEDRASSPPGVSIFPREPILSTQRYYGRCWPQLAEVAEPNYVCYGRLMYEQKNFERGGWDLGFITPVVSALEFYGDFITMPYHRGTDICRCFECSAGYCLPGDPVPFLLYPPELSVSGALTEVAAVAAVVAIFP